MDWGLEEGVSVAHTVPQFLTHISSSLLHTHTAECRTKTRIAAHPVESSSYANPVVPGAWPFAVAGCECGAAAWAMCFEGGCVGWAE
jgi:hypothetical protein